MPANTVAPFFKPGQDITGHATEDITGKRFVTAAPGGRGTLPHIAPAAAGDPVLGVAGHDVEDGDNVHVHVAGVVTVTAADDITAGTEVSVGADGQVAPTSEGAVVVGYAVANAATGADAPILLK
ncbi:capsid cement protein [Nesterenkonia sp. HG001]|uniref:capsid cement protein n=1 Tax=Nesterenkonia sp. HG001 TaxID=2983207 RepID=UPI002AC684B7|nr:capsid cement protein [Nesterenkonia sp. HG001]MDZ5076743.1 DUF2190 family protein [Nesterenkonia sp. HG001]